MADREPPSEAQAGGVRGGRPRSTRSWEVLIVLGVAGVAVLITESLFAPPRQSAGPPSSTPSPTVQSERHTNATAGYSFLRPAGWEVVDSGTASELTSPDRDVIVSFGLGPEGGLREASAEFTASIEDAYDEVRLHEPRREEIAGREAIVAGGSAVNDADVAIRFLAITVGIDGEIYAISVFVADASDPVRVLPAVEDIVASFEPA
jgi:predicted Zn-dependent protease